MENSRLRFRVWDKSRYVYFTFSDFETSEYGKTQANGHVLSDDDVFEQCTGLSDKNGKLIYEGDICFQKRKNFPHNKAIGVIFRTIYGEYVLRVDMSSQWSDEYKDFSLHKYPVEIIGNIHENQELIKED